jgi:hypothetical protein
VSLFRIGEEDSERVLDRNRRQRDFPERLGCKDAFRLETSLGK